MADAKLFRLQDNLTALDIADSVERFFEEKKGMLSEMLETPQGVIIQAKPKDAWKKFIGMDNSIQVEIMDQGESIMVRIGGGKWIDKAGAAAAGAILFAPLAITAGLGAWANKKLPEEIFNHIESFILSGGKTATISMQKSSAIKENEIVCPYCKGKNTKDTRFCNSCGSKLVHECSKCGNDVNPNTVFCSKCGNNIQEEMKQQEMDRIIICDNCGSKIAEGSAFCAKCGTKAPEPAALGMPRCPHCDELLETQSKFCPHCGQAVSD